MAFSLCGLGRKSHGCDCVGVLRLKGNLEKTWPADGLGELCGRRGDSLSNQRFIKMGISWGMRVATHFGFLVYATGLTRIILIGNGHTLETSLQRSGGCHLVGENSVDAALR